ncbi:hypothetical protein ACHAXS_000454 [Conticribra weissflogii]
MELPQGIETKYSISKDHVLKLLANLYGQKQAGSVWNQYLMDKLASIGLKQSAVDECIFYRNNIVFIVFTEYIDNGIFLGPSDQVLTQVIQEIKDTGLDAKDQGYPSDCVGVNVHKFADDAIISDVGLKDKYIKNVPANASLHLHAFKSSPHFNGNFNYCLVVGKLNYLAQTTTPDMMYATHQIAKYSSDPQKEHSESITYLVKYLCRTHNLGLKFRPNPKRGFDCFCDADVPGNWNELLAPTDSSTANSCSGWILFYTACPIIWASKLQSQIAYPLLKQSTLHFLLLYVIQYPSCTY